MERILRLIGELRSQPLWKRRAVSSDLGQVGRLMSPLTMALAKRRLHSDPRTRSLCDLTRHVARDSAGKYFLVTRELARAMVCDRRRLDAVIDTLAGILLRSRTGGGCRSGRCRAVHVPAFSPVPREFYRDTPQGKNMFAALLKLAGKLSAAGVTTEQLTLIMSQVQELLSAEGTAARIRALAALAKSVAPLIPGDNDDRVLAALVGLSTTEEFDSLVEAVETALGRPKIRYQLSGHASPELDIPVAELIADQLR